VTLRSHGCRTQDTCRPVWLLRTWVGRVAQTHIPLLNLYRVTGMIALIPQQQMLVPVPGRGTIFYLRALLVRICPTPFPRGTIGKRTVLPMICPTPNISPLHIRLLVGPRYRSLQAQIR